jgi:hypothetical protein
MGAQLRGSLYNMPDRHHSHGRIAATPVPIGFVNYLVVSQFEFGREMSAVSASVIRPLSSALTWFESVGRTVTDFGFGSLVGKYEEYFGRRVTRALLIIVGLSVVAVGVGAIWQWLIAPILMLFRTPLWGRTLAQLAIVAIAIGGGVAVGLMLVAALGDWHRFRKTRAIIDRSKELFDRADERYKCADASLNDIRQMNDQSYAMMVGIAAVLRERMAEIPPDQKEAYQVLLENAERFVAEAKRPTNT